jgi:hypothetical protein
MPEEKGGGPTVVDDEGGCCGDGGGARAIGESPTWSRGRFFKLLMI